MNYPMHINAFRKVSYNLLDAFTPFFLSATNKIKQQILSPIHKRYLQISLTYNCQCRCLHCGMSWYAKKTNTFNSQEIFDIIDEMVFLDFGQLDFFGGEPLLDENIYAYIKYASRKGIFTHINTNGILLTEQNVEMLYKNGLNAVSISFDSHNPEKHNANRGINNAFESALEGARRCIGKKIRTIMSVYADKQSILNRDTEKLIELAKKERFFRVRLLTNFKSGNLHNAEPIINDEQMSRRVQELTKDRLFVKPHGITKCFIPYKTTAYLSPYGDVQPCSMVPISFGNVREEKLERIIKKMREHPIYHIKEPGCIMNSYYIKDLFFSKIDCNKEILPISIDKLASSLKIG